MIVNCFICNGIGCLAANGEKCTDCEGYGKVRVKVLGPAYPEKLSAREARNRFLAEYEEAVGII